MLRIVLGFAVCALLAVAGSQARAANTATMGMEEGDPAQVVCPNKHYLAGFAVQWDTVMSGLQPYCVAMASDGAWAGGAAIHLDLMMSDALPGGKRLDLFCPRDFYAFGFHGFSHVYGIHSIMQLDLICRNLLTGQLWKIGTTFNGASLTEWPGGQCADDSVATGVFGNINSARIIRFGFTCARTRPAIIMSGKLVAKPKVKIGDLVAKQPDSGMVQKLPGTSISDAIQSPDDGLVGNGAAILKQPKIGTSVFVDPAAEPPIPDPPAEFATQTFAPPLVASGLHLYACQALDSDVCGKPVADIFCQQQGFARTESFGTDRIKGPVETIGGQTCNKKKCKAFEEIVCVR